MKAGVMLKQNDCDERKRVLEVRRKKMFPLIYRLFNICSLLRELYIFLPLEMLTSRIDFVMVVFHIESNRMCL